MECLYLQLFKSVFLALDLLLLHANPFSFFDLEIDDKFRIVLELWYRSGLTEQRPRKCNVIPG